MTPEEMRERAKVVLDVGLANDTTTSVTLWLAAAEICERLDKLCAVPQFTLIPSVQSIPTANAP